MREGEYESYTKLSSKCLNIYNNQFNRNRPTCVWRLPSGRSPPLDPPQPSGGPRYTGELHYLTTAQLLLRWPHKPSATRWRGSVRSVISSAIWRMKFNKKLIRRWDSERELSLRWHCTHSKNTIDSCINSATDRFLQHRRFSITCTFHSFEGCRGKTCFHKSCSCLRKLLIFIYALFLFRKLWNLLIVLIMVRLLI